MPARTRHTSPRLLAGLLGAALGLAVLVLLAGCGGSSSAGTHADTEAVVKATPTKSRPAPDAVRITFSGTDVTPTGGQAKVKVGQPLKLYIKADKAGEIHVHSSPEQHLDYPKGTSTAALTFDKPGVIEVESHALDKQILQVTVR